MEPTAKIVTPFAKAKGAPIVSAAHPPSLCRINTWYSETVDTDPSGEL